MVLICIQRNIRRPVQSKCIRKTDGATVNPNADSWMLLLGLFSMNQEVPPSCDSRTNIDYMPLFLTRSKPPLCAPPMYRPIFLIGLSAFLEQLPFARFHTAGQCRTCGYATYETEIYNSNQARLVLTNKNSKFIFTRIILIFRKLHQYRQAQRISIENFWLLSGSARIPASLPLTSDGRVLVATRKSV